VVDRIVATLDGSRTAEVILPYVEELAGRAGAQIILVGVCDPVLGEADARNLYGSYLQQVSERLKKGLWETGAGAAASVDTEVLAGAPAEEILKFGESVDASLIVMASHGASSKGPWLLGSIAAKVLRATRRPVLLVRTPRADRPGKHTIKRILMPLDGSQIGAAAISFTEKLAQWVSAEIVLLHVVPPPSFFMSFAGAGQVTPEEELAARRSGAVNYLEGVKQELTRQGMNVTTALASGSPADQVVEYAAKNAIDLIAMSSHGRTGIGRWVFGSVTDKILHAGDAPVLVVRAESKG
jgi:nucleotide-binding universal stress UspA family protein